MMLDEIIDNFPDNTFLKADGFDEAVIGLDDSTMRLIYSVSKCINILVNGGMSQFDALEYFNYNVSGSYMGEQTPIWCWDTY